ncbi:MAG: hypothetical protein IPM32_07510 [Ignavibacteriae bacterium]|nr:hypothetical protein [Ignavibacteriota bacterium]
MKRKIILGIILFSVFSCADFEIISKWNEKEISIDGSKQDWKGKINYFEDEKVAIGVLNDDDNIYLCLITSDRSKILKILSNGFTIWFESPNNYKNNFGIQYPIKKKFDDRFENMPDFINENEPSNGDKIIKRGEIFPGKLFEKFKTEQNEILIINEDNFPLNVYKLKNDSGLEISANLEQNQFIYELKIPYAKNKTNKIYYDAFPNDDIILRFETGEIEKPKFTDRSKRGGIRNPGNEGNDREFTPRGGNNESSGKRMGMDEMMKPIEFSLKILLASNK